MKLETSREKPFPSDFHPSYDNKPRRKIYREVLAGLRYHKGEKLSLVTFSFQRGTIIDIRTIFKELTTWIKRLTGERIDYCRTDVFDKKVDDTWRVHTHAIWNAPYLKQALIVEKIQAYIGENAHVYIKLLDGNDKKAARYLMQYLGNQDGFVKFNKSRNWLPKGYNDFWNETRLSYYEHVPMGIRKPLDDAERVFKLMTQSSEDWKKAAFFDVVDAWIDQRRDITSKESRDLTTQHAVITPEKLLKFDRNLMRHYQKVCRRSGET